MVFSELNEEFMSKKLSEREVSVSPFEQFKLWYDEATASKIYQPNAAILATAGKGCFPSVRTILMKGFDEKGVVFFTNYDSRKAKELAQNPNASILFFWAEPERQIRIEGSVSKISEEESDEYFKTRPVGSRLGAWASPQSQVIPNREWLENKYKEFRNKYNKDEIPRPSNWGGYILIPVSFEFWQGRPNRLHDRILYRLKDNLWDIRRLAP